jgi:hypothetical protein
LLKKFNVKKQENSLLLKEMTKKSQNLH